MTRVLGCLYMRVLIWYKATLYVNADSSLGICESVIYHEDLTVRAFYKLSLADLIRTL